MSKLLFGHIQNSSDSVVEILELFLPPHFVAHMIADLVLLSQLVRYAFIMNN